MYCFPTSTLTFSSDPAYSLALAIDVESPALETLLPKLPDLLEKPLGFVIPLFNFSSTSSLIEVQRAIQTSINAFSKLAERSVVRIPVARNSHCIMVDSSGVILAKLQDVVFKLSDISANVEKSAIDLVVKGDVRLVESLHQAREKLEQSPTEHRLDPSGVYRVCIFFGQDVDVTQVVDTIKAEGLIAEDESDEVILEKVVIRIGEGWDSVLKSVDI